MTTYKAVQQALVDIQVQRKAFLATSEIQIKTALFQAIATDLGVKFETKILEIENGSQVVIFSFIFAGSECNLRWGATLCTLTVENILTSKSVDCCLLSAQWVAMTTVNIVLGR